MHSVSYEYVFDSSSEYEKSRKYFDVAECATDNQLLIWKAIDCYGWRYVGVGVEFLPKTNYLSIHLISRSEIPRISKFSISGQNLKWKQKREMSAAYKMLFMSRGNQIQFNFNQTMKSIQLPKCKIVWIVVCILTMLRDSEKNSIFSISAWIILVPPSTYQHSTILEITRTITYAYIRLNLNVHCTSSFGW